MKLAVVNDVHVGKSLEHNGRVRASSHLVEDMLPSFLKEIMQQHSPDALINLGDLIRSEERNIDLQKYSHLINNFEGLEIPVIHLLGNHELKKMSLEEIEKLPAAKKILSKFETENINYKPNVDFFERQKILLNFSAVSLAYSTCCCWSLPVGTSSVS